MKFFADKKFLFKLIVALCICLTLVNFGMAPVANAESTISKIGGLLLDPVVDLLLVLGDGIMGIIQKSIMGSDATVIFDKIQGDWWQAIKALIVIALAICAVVFIGGVAPIALAIKALEIVAIGVALNVVTDGGVTAACSVISATYFDDTLVLPTFTIGPEEIFSGKILLFDPNVFNPKEIIEEIEIVKEDPVEQPNSNNSYASINGEETNTKEQEIKRYYYEEDGEKIPTSMNSAAYDLKDTIAKWYYTIRTLAIIGLSLVLLYIGIRILVSSVASEKSKYKQMLNDWVIAICLVFLMQYIMIFANEFVESVCKMLNTASQDKTHLAVITDTQKATALEDSVAEINEDYINKDEHVISWPTNLMGKFRVEAQQHNGTAEYAGYAICYLVLVMYTVFFTFTYLKRLLYLLFLTVISPFVAMTYPIDKIKDGQAQAFNMWMKEYIYNLLIQPFHLLLYTIFVSMAFDLAGSSIIYSLVVIGFMIPAEKFLRTMFGFNKASTPGFLGGAGGAVMTMSAIKSLAGFASGGKGGSSKKSGGNDSKIKDADNKGYYDRAADSGNSMSSLLGEAAAEGSDGNSGGPTLDGQQDKLTDKQKMLDADDENYLSEDWDAAERDNYARDAYPVNDNSQQYTDDEYRQILKDSGYSDEEIAELMDDNNPDNANQEPQSSPEEQILGNSNDSNKPEPRMSYIGARFSNFKRDNLNPQKAKEKAAKVLAGTAKNAAKFGLGAAGAGIGIAAGIASGSPGDVLKYGVSGAYAGSAIGKGTANRVESSIKHADEVEKQKHEDALRTQYGNKGYKQIKNDELDEKFMKDADMRKLYKQKLDLKNKDEIDAAMKKAVEFRKYGITDNDIITQAIKLDKNYKTSTEVSKENIAAAKLATVSKSQKEFDTYMKKYKEMPGVDDKKYNSMYKKVKDINSEYLV